MADERTSESFPFLPGVLAGLFALVWARSLWTLLHEIADADLFTHLATGRRIAESGIPSSDVLSWPGRLFGLPSTYHEWLYDLLTYRLWQVSGYRGIYLVTATLLATVPMLVYALAYVRSRRSIVGVVAAVASALMILKMVAPRPQAVTYCLVLTIALLLERRRWGPALLVYVLGVNLHGAAFPVYLLVMAFYLLPAQWPAFGAAVAATVLNPIGADLLVYPFKTVLTAPAVPIIEMQPVTPLTFPLHFALLALAAIVMLRPGVPWRDRLFVLAVAVLSVSAVRQMVFFYVLAVPVVVPHALGPAAHRPVLSGRAQRLVHASVVGALALGAATWGQRAAATPLEIDKGYPARAAAYMRQHGLTRVFNHWNQGGYLLFVSPPPLIDGRYEPFAPVYNGGRDIVGEYFEVLSSRAAPDAFLAKYGIRSLLLPRDCMLVRTMRGRADFRVAYEDGEYVVMERLAPAAGASLSRP